EASNAARSHRARLSSGDREAFAGHSRGLRLFLLLLLAGLTACHREQKAENSENQMPVPVRVATVESRPRNAMEEVVGSVRAKLHAGVEAKVSGKVERMLAVPGQMVKSGDLLAELDGREIKAKLDQALAVREQTGLELRRATELLKEKTISQQEFDL